MSQIQVPPLTNTANQEPAMYLERPSSARSHDIRHVLAKTFRELFTRDTVEPETIKNLHTSKHNDDPYHERYVTSLQQIFEERERRLAECAMLERHIMQAQARAMSSDEREMNRVAASCDQYSDLGLPSGGSYFRSCLDTELLKKHGLLVPEDYSTHIPTPAKPPKGSAEPSYLRQTVSSDHRLNPQGQDGESPLPSVPHGDGSESSLSSRSEYSGDGSYTDEEPMNRLWQCHLNNEQREVDKFDMNKLDSKVNFLKNPRHIPPSALPVTRSLIKQKKIRPKETGIKPKPEKKTAKEPSVIFLASPPVMVFPKYSVGQVYEMTLELKNVTSVLRPCRVLPPSTPYFSIGLGQFPGEQGLVAPGMSCHYTIRFNPDSLADYDDSITVQTQSSTPMVIQLQGRRQPPVLSLPPVWDVGYCLAGGIHIVHFLVSNNGGPGKFCLLPTSSWPATSFKSSVKNGAISLPPFEVRPSVFELLSGEKTIIEVAFRPNQVREYSEEITLICDNCQVKHFNIKGEAQLARVKITEIDGGISSAVPGEICDMSAQHLVKFEELNPFTFTDKTVHIKNQTNVDIKFGWDIYKPVLKAPIIPGGENSNDEMIVSAVGRVSDIDSVFSIHPPSGTLHADSIMEFKVTFAPPVTGEFNSVLHMLLHQVPCPPPDMLSENVSLSSIDLDRREKAPEINLPMTLPSFHDLSALEVEVKGPCVPLNVVLHPYAMIIPGAFLAGVTVKKQVVLVNHSYSGITFNWQPYSEDHILEVEPPFGELGPGMALDLELSLTGCKPGKINHTLFCYVDSLNEPVHLHVEADIKGPDICIEESDLNFGLVHLGQAVSREITLNNMCQSVTRWSIEQCPLEESIETNNKRDSEFLFEPSCGHLKPLERKTLTVTFNPANIQSLNTVFGVTVEDEQKHHISVCGEVQMPRACLLNCELTLNEVYLNVPVIKEFTLINQTLLPTFFKWGQPVGDDRDHMKLNIEPSDGILQSREELRLSIYLMADKQGELSCIRVPCEVEGMDSPIWLALTTTVKGLSVQYKVSLDGPGSTLLRDDLSLDFGEETSLGNTPKQYLHITNDSGITAPFSLHMEYFSSKPPLPPNCGTTGGRGGDGKPFKGRVSLKKTPNLADPHSRTSSKAYKDVCQSMLMERKGAAFVIYPSSGEIGPFSEEVIEVTGFSDMWGEYTDNMTIKVGDLEAITVPVRMNVVGCPLNFQLTAAQPNQRPIIRFGSHIADTAPICRKVQINNTSPFDICLDWEVFQLSDNDEKLVDFVVRFGEMFPARDSDGKEIVPTLPEPPAMKRYPTDYIFSSPSTTPAVSRQVTQVDSKEIHIPGTINETSPTSECPDEGPQIVSTFLRLHDGTESDKPYDVYPKQLVIAGKSSGVVTVRFTPLSTRAVGEGLECLSYAHAYITLADKGDNKNGLVKRKQGFEMETLRMEMTAYVKPALLRVECAEEEQMRFRGAMSDLLSGTELTSESLNVCSALLTNQTETPMTFQLRVKSPFLLVNLDPETNEIGAMSNTVTDMCTLKPQHTLPVKVAFKVDIDLLKFLDALETGEEVESIELEVNNGERKLQFLYDLYVEFNNSTVQCVPLHATLSVPSLILSRETLDFGTCLVGQRREMELTVSNRTASASQWTVTIESQTDTCVAETFKVLPSSGLLEAYITHISNSKTLIKVFFTAKHAELYEVVFVFQGRLGEEPRRLVVTGQGSYDGKHQAIVNI